MMPTIRVDDDVYRLLQKRATPFEDTPNSVLRRLLGLDKRRVIQAPANASVSTQARRNLDLTPQSAYRKPILGVLAEKGGSVPTRQVLSELPARMNLKPDDYGVLKGGAIRWQNRALWERFGMVADGLVKRDSPRGIWELSPEGWRDVGTS